MNEHRFINRSQPQTLYMAVILCYLTVLFNLLGGYPALVLVGFVLAIGAYGIANEQKWGYGLGLLVAFFPFFARVAVNGLNNVFTTDIISLMFEIALVVLLLHPQSREYERIWFK